MPTSFQSDSATIDRPFEGVVSIAIVRETRALLEENIMLRRGLVLFAVLAVLCSLSACGKKEKQEESKAAKETAKPAIVPGEMALIPAGEFVFGTNDKDSKAYPQQKINLPAFWIDKYEVTNAQMLEFTANTGYVGEGDKENKSWRAFFTMDKGMVPVMYITWNDANAYCKSQGKRLPTEEEWEKAARGPNGNVYPWGNEWAEGRSATSEAGYREPKAIGEFDDVSFYGVHDMLGNVQEWTSSKYGPYKGNPKADPLAAQNLRIIRGLSFRYKARMGHLWDRSAFPPSLLADIGCRCAKDATPEEAAKAK